MHKTIRSFATWMILFVYLSTLTSPAFAAASTNPAVVEQYLHMVRYDSPYEANPATVSSALRLWFESRQLAGAQVARWTPFACGLAWAVWHFWRKRGGT